MYVRTLNPQVATGSICQTRGEELEKGAFFVLGKSRFLILFSFCLPSLPSPRGDATAMTCPSTHPSILLIGPVVRRKLSLLSALDLFQRCSYSRRQEFLQFQTEEDQEEAAQGERERDKERERRRKNERLFKGLFVRSLPLSLSLPFHAYTDHPSTTTLLFPPPSSRYLRPCILVSSFCLFLVDMGTSRQQVVNGGRGADGQGGRDPKFSVPASNNFCSKK